MRPEKNKTVCLLSIQFLDDSKSDKSHKKPAMILEYKRNNGGVDNAVELVREYCCARRTSKWPLRLFKNMRDAEALNVFTLKTKTGAEANEIEFASAPVLVFKVKTFKASASRMFLKSLRGHFEVRLAQEYSLTNSTALSTPPLLRLYSRIIAGFL